MFLVELALILVVAQVLGLAVLHWASKRASRARAVLAPFTAAAAYLTGSWVFWSAEAHRVATATGRPPCGAFGAVSAFATLGGTLAEFVMGCLVVGGWLLIRAHSRRQRATFA